MLEMSKKENVAGRLGWQGNAQAHRKRFSDLQPREVITILAILFGKSRARLSKKSVVTYLKQIVHKVSELLFYRNENWHKTRKA